MKLPIQAQPVSRKRSSVRISENPSQYVHASDCNADCAWMLASCVPAGIAGVGAFAACLGAQALANPNCRDCIGEFVKAYVEVPVPKGPRGQPM